MGARCSRASGQVTSRTDESRATVVRIETNTLRAEQNLQRQLDWIGRYDARSAAVLGIAVAMLGFLATEAPPPAKWDHICFLGTFAAVIPIAFSLVAIYLGQFPRTGSPNASLVYFGTIAGLKADEFFKRFCDRTDEEHLADLCQQAHHNSTLIDKKFKALKAGLIALLVAVLPWTFTIVWFRLVKA